MTTFNNASLYNVNDYRAELSRGATLTDCTLINVNDKWVFGATLQSKSRKTMLRLLNEYRLRRFNSLTSAYNYIKRNMDIDTFTVRNAQENEKIVGQ